MLKKQNSLFVLDIDQPANWFIATLQSMIAITNYSLQETVYQQVNRQLKQLIVFNSYKSDSFVDKTYNSDNLFNDKSHRTYMKEVQALIEA